MRLSFFGDWNYTRIHKNFGCALANTNVHAPSPTRTPPTHLVHKSTIDKPHISRTRSVPRRTHTFTHTPAESLNRDIQDRAIITRQMNTWRQSGLGRGAEQSGATEVMISRTKRQTWENRFKSQPQGHTTPQAWPWRTFRNTRAFSPLSPAQTPVHSCL